jgi:hypothetical protein
MTTFVKLTVDSVAYYISDDGYAGENYWHPFLLSPPDLELSGDGWIKLQSGSLVLKNEPWNANHPFGYSNGDFATLLSTPSKEYDVSINYNNESMVQNEVLWSGKTILDRVSNEVLTFKLFDEQPTVSSYLGITVGLWPVDYVNNDNPALITIFVAGSGTGAPTVLKKGDQVVFKQKSGTSTSSIAPIYPSTPYMLTEDASYQTASPYIKWQFRVNVDRSSASGVDCDPETATSTSSTPPVWWVQKTMNFTRHYFSPGHMPREVDPEGSFVTSYDGYSYVTPDSLAGDASDLDLYQEGVSQTITQGAGYGTYLSHSWRLSSGNWSGLVTVDYPDGSAYFTINDVIDSWVGTVEITKAPNADSTTLAALDYTVEGRAKAYDVVDEICKNTNYQFFDRFANSSDANKTVYLVDRANAPSTKAISAANIISVDYKNIFPVASVKCSMTVREFVGSAADDNFNLSETRNESSVYNANNSAGKNMTVRQMNDRMEAQVQFLQAILDANSKPKVSVTIDSINASILPGDNLTFTEIDAPVTVSSLLVRAINYDLGKAQTTFTGDATITIVEET